MSNDLFAKNKLDFINEKVSKSSDDDPNVDLLKRCNGMVTLWILNVLIAEIVESVIYSCSSYAIFIDIDDFFGK